MKQTTALLTTFFTFLLLCVFLYGAIFLLNHVAPQTPIHLLLRITDVFVGLTIYIKTSVDFAIFIGNLMRHNQGIKKRIAIEIGTSLGNALGTLAVLCIWSFFREVPLLMVIMILLASLVLFQMAEEGLNDLRVNHALPKALRRLLDALLSFLTMVNRYPKLVLQKLLPGKNLATKSFTSLTALLFFSLSIPFLLGLDDFAGYLPLFSVVNVFGFSVGIFLGHMLLTSFLFLSPKKTVVLVNHSLVLALGSLALLGIGLYGLYDVLKLLLSLLG